MNHSGVGEIPLLEVKGLKKHFNLKQRPNKDKNVLKAVDGVSFSLNKGEALGLVGESGCGKSTTARAILHLTEPDCGEVYFNGIDLSKLNAEGMRALRKEMQIIFQDPLASLNPKRNIRGILSEPFAIHRIMDEGFREKEISELLKKTGLSEQLLDRFPHEFSGGQLQRIGIARALALKPRLIVADEPVSALDVSIQAQIINLLSELKENEGIAFLFISHDMGVVQHFCDRVAVMYLGKIVEIAAVESLYANALHPYTSALISAVPSMDDKIERKTSLIKEEADPYHPRQGCAFQARCPIKEKICEAETPILQEVFPGHRVACHLCE